ncbi:substrate-binding domain-containing protein [Ereboglobus luteus]|uniref:HTH gntR-type domain-containing protein n=1 Tax=Ereboglobus luteus TaxID=1796921 RepID=A0A2U8E3Q1_9BACT|nr:substrate-binding domain-containing protein [Ereboglobus luteus]AWI09527.1 hypothetical protein CKA38_09980 [Ereboglobus luteus]
MITPPQRNSLELQTATILRKQIAQGAWTEWLPGERELGETLQVSRYTVRAALAQLRKDGVIATEKGVGNKIARRRGRGKAAIPGSNVGLLVCGEFHQLLPTHIFWIDQLRVMLDARGSRLHMVDGRAYARANPARALKKLAQQNPHSCWILLLSSEAVQAWFQKNAIPCVVAGSTYVGIDLPCCDLDYRAACRHAADMLLRRGHRRITLLIKRSRRAGDILSEAGFEEAFARTAVENASPVIRHHNSTVEGVAETVRQLMTQKTPPTALLVADPFDYLTVASCLAKLGLDVPRDVSVISRDGESCYHYMLPRPSCYAANMRLFARALLGAITPALSGGQLAVRVHYLMPEFTEGASVLSLSVKK